MDNRIVLFNRPIWFVQKDLDSRIIVEVWGFVLPSDLSSKKVNALSIEDYLNYLCGVSKWDQEGNRVEGTLWVSNLTGETHYNDEPFIQKYQKRARQQMHLTYLVFSTNKILDKETDGILNGEFLVSRSLYNNIMEFGVIVDVQKSPKE